MRVIIIMTRSDQPEPPAVAIVRQNGLSSASSSGIVENGDFRFIRSLSSEHFTYMATRQLADDTTVNNLGHCFTPNFSKTVCDTAKVTIDYK